MDMEWHPRGSLKEIRMNNQTRAIKRKTSFEEALTERKAAATKFDGNKFLKGRKRKKKLEVDKNQSQGDAVSTESMGLIDHKLKLVEKEKPSVFQTEPEQMGPNISFAIKHPKNSLVFHIQRVS